MRKSQKIFIRKKFNQSNKKGVEILMKQIKIMTLKQKGEKSISEFEFIVNNQLKNLPNSKVVTAFMPNINRLYVVLEYDK